MATRRIEKYIRFRERDPLPKTRRWDVINKKTNEVIGEIQWYGGWRKYVYWTEDNTFYDWDCMREIADFCQEQTRGQMQRAREIKHNG